MFRAKFDKVQAERFLESISADEPLSPPGDGWTDCAVQTLAGVCMQRMLVRYVFDNVENFDETTDDTDKIMTGVLAGIFFGRNLTADLEEMLYDRRFESYVEADVTLRKGVEPPILPVKGFKQSKDEPHTDDLQERPTAFAVLECLVGEGLPFKNSLECWDGFMSYRADGRPSGSIDKELRQGLEDLIAETDSRECWKLRQYAELPGVCSKALAFADWKMSDLPGESTPTSIGG